MTVDEHIAALHAFMRADHEEYIAQVRGWAESAEADGHVAAARQHRAHVGRLEAMDKPWEASPRPA
ncbi:hypothetical protein [Catellatospora chokoriensis]|uniref:Uncharacterized protein n=1 Tax=Catellatospora chokoriensis TaxID=310353 RepID=A0A8J3NRU9_9ACTN|nr:hypothetical protein [Catellatospora chokoriensis]GIF90552.1 hypothetical protein Cch02nite_39960 [Catellatospora chokoriensis]